jgi:hypothetical protein
VKATQELPAPQLTTLYTKTSPQKKIYVLAAVKYKGHKTKKEEMRKPYFRQELKKKLGRNSVVGIANRYGLDGTGIESRWRRDFLHPFRPALGLTQLPVTWIPGLFPGDKAAEEWR